MIRVLQKYFSFVFKQKTAYEMRISDWSSDVCSSDLPLARIIVVADGLVSTGTIVDMLAGEGDDALLVVNEADALPHFERVDRSEERRVGKECVNTVSTRGSAYQ